MRRVIILFDSRLKQQLDIINLGSYQQTQKNLLVLTTARVFIPPSQVASSQNIFDSKIMSGQLFASETHKLQLFQKLIDYLTICKIKFRKPKISTNFFCAFFTEFLKNT